MVTGVQKPRSKDATLRRAQLEVAALEQQLEELRVENLALKALEEALSDICAAKGLAVAFLLTTPNGVQSFWECTQLPEDPMDVPVPGVEILCGHLRIPGPGVARELIDALSRPDSVHTPIHATLMAGQPLCFLHLCLLCLCKDTDIHAAVANRSLRLSYDMCHVYVSKLAGIAAGGEEGAQALSSLVHYLVESMAEACGMFVANPAALWHGAGESGKGQAGFNQVPKSVLDRVTENLQLTPEQVENLIQGQHTFQQLERAYHAEHKRVEAGLHQLQGCSSAGASSGLQQGQTQQGQTLLQGLLSEPAASSATAEASASASLAGTLRSNSNSSSCSSSTAAASLCSTQQLPGAGQLQGSLDLLDPNEHLRLLALLEQQKGLLHKVEWLDWCFMFYQLGHLTWVQVAQLVVTMYPFRPAPLQWMRHFLAKQAMDRMMQSLRQSIWPGQQQQVQQAHLRVVHQQQQQQQSLLSGVHEEQMGLPPVCAVQQQQPEQLSPQELQEQQAPLWVVHQ